LIVLDLGLTRMFDNRLRRRNASGASAGQVQDGWQRSAARVWRNNKIVIIDAAERAELVRLRREALDAMEPQPHPASNEAVRDSGNFAYARPVIMGST
jgi:hypothetical protein